MDANNAAARATFVDRQGKLCIIRPTNLSIDAAGRPIDLNAD
jgi:hypothetical protein